MKKEEWLRKPKCKEFTKEWLRSHFYRYDFKMILSLTTINIVTLTFIYIIFCFFWPYCVRNLSKFLKSANEEPSDVLEQLDSNLPTLTTTTPDTTEAIFTTTNPVHRFPNGMTTCFRTRFFHSLNINSTISCISTILRTSSKYWHITF